MPDSPPRIEKLIQKLKQSDNQDVITLAIICEILYHNQNVMERENRKQFARCEPDLS